MSPERVERIRDNFEKFIFREVTEMDGQVRADLKRIPLGDMENEMFDIAHAIEQGVLNCWDVATEEGKHVATMLYTIYRSGKNVVFWIVSFGGDGVAGNLYERMRGAIIEKAKSQGCTTIRAEAVRPGAFKGLWRCGMRPVSVSMFYEIKED